MNLNRTKGEVEQLIAAARELLKPTPVRLHHVPQWLMRRLKPMRPRFDGRYLHHSASVVLDEVVTASGGRWLDHWGSTTIGVQQRFVAEPYQVTAADVASLEKIAKATGLEWYLCPNSWWYPGATIRIVIREPAKEPASPT